VTDINVVSPGLPENDEVRIAVVGVGVGIGVAVEVGSVVGTSETTGWFVVTAVTGVPEGEGFVAHPVTRIKKIRVITINRGIFIV
jgi:hypothetical protein